MPPLESTIRPLAEVTVLYDVTVRGKTYLTTYTKSPKVVNAWINAANATVKRLVGFDVEVYEEKNAADDSTKVYIDCVQFCVDSHCLVFQVEKTPSYFLLSLYRFLTDHNNIFVSTKASRKANQLRTHFGNTRCRMQIKDVGVIGGKLNHYPELALPHLTWKVWYIMGIAWPDVDPSHWGRFSTLTEPQVHSASLNCVLNLELALSLHL